MIALWPDESEDFVIQADGRMMGVAGFYGFPTASAWRLDVAFMTDGSCKVRGRRMAVQLCSWHHDQPDKTVEQRQQAPTRAVWIVASPGTLLVAASEQPRQSFPPLTGASRHAFG